MNKNLLALIILELFCLSCLSEGASVTGKLVSKQPTQEETVSVAYYTPILFSKNGTKLTEKPETKPASNLTGKTEMKSNVKTEPTSKLNSKSTSKPTQKSTSKPTKKSTSKSLAKTTVKSILKISAGKVEKL